MKKFNKGYTITVTSWENDADNYNTKSKTVATKEEAKVWWDMMQLCKSKSRNPNNLGNTYGGFNKNQIETAANFIKQHHGILVPQDDISNKSDEHLSSWFCDLAGELLGYGEDYACRVMESCDVVYSPENIDLEEINF